MVDLWFYGDIVLEDRVISNKVAAYNPIVNGGLLKVKEGRQIKTYSARQVREFHFYDSLQERNRNFYSIPIKFADERVARRRQFVEMLVEGQRISLVGVETTQTFYFTVDQLKTANTSRVYSFFIFVHASGIMVPLDRQSILMHTVDKREEIKSYI